MKLVNDANIQGLHPVMRPVLKEVEKEYIRQGIADGAVVTCGLNGEHSAGSWHYYGVALDFRTYFFSDDQKHRVTQHLKEVLPQYDVILESTHLHIEVGDNLARSIGVLHV